MVSHALDMQRRELEDDIRAIAPSGVRYDIRRISEEWIDFLHQDELAVTAGFTHARRIEFATGRSSLRSLFQGQAARDLPVLIGERRAPKLPLGLHASISHCDAFVATVASGSANFRGLGVDIELLDRVTPDLADVLLSCSERFDLQAGRSTLPLACYFSAKEAVFKAIHGLIGKYIDFLDLALVFSRDHFVAKPLFHDPTLETISIEGRFVERDPYVLSIAWAQPSRA